MVALLVWASGAYDTIPPSFADTVALGAAGADDLDLPVTRFGSVPFRVIWPDGQLTMPDWSQESYAVSRHVVGGDRTIVQTLGKGPLIVTHRLWLDSFDDFRALQAQVQRIDTLVLFADMTSAGGAYVTYVDVRGTGFVSITGVTLMALGAPQVFRDGDGAFYVETDATFQRATL